MAGRAQTREALRSAVVWEALCHALPTGRTLRVLDAGGGTGGFAVPLAELGHTVTVVDRSPDSLAALERRARDAGVGDRIVAMQGDADRLAEVLRGERYDLVLCHSVLEFVEDAGAVLVVLAAALEVGGTASLLVPSRTAAVLAHAVAGRFAEAEALLDDDAGRWGPADPARRRFRASEVLALVQAAGLRVEAVHGVRTLADLVPSSVAEGDPLTAAALGRLEGRLSEQPEFLPVAGRLHVLAVRP